MVYKRGRIYWIKYYRNGKPYYESTRSTKEADAKRLMKKREGEISEGKLPGVYFDKVRFDELAEDLLNDYRINGKSTLDNVQRVVGLHLEPFFGGYRVTNITTALVRKYIAQRLEAGAANATINRELAALKRAFNLASQCTPPKVPQVPHIPMLKENNTRKGFLEHDQFVALRAALPEHLQGLVTFGYQTGWRLGEITGLTWDRVDMAQGIVRLEAGETKNDEARTVYLDVELKAALRNQVANRRIGCPYVFHREGKRIHRFDRAWTTALKAARLKGTIFHDLRRTAVRNMVRAGIPERVAMMISGHKTRSVFDRYNIVSADDLRLAAQKLTAYLPPMVTNTVTTANSLLPANSRGSQPIELTPRNT